MNKYDILNHTTAATYYTVSAKFFSKGQAKGFEMPSPKLYTYKVRNSLALEVGDFATVMTPSHGLQVVEIVEVGTPLAIPCTFRYKHVVGSVDLDVWNDLLENEDAILTAIDAGISAKKAERVQASVEELVDADTFKTIAKYL